MVFDTNWGSLFFVSFFGYLWVVNILLRCDIRVLVVVLWRIFIFGDREKLFVRIRIDFFGGNGL